MERRPLNGSEAETSDPPKDIARRRWPARAADFLQSWRERLLGKSEDAEDEETTDSSEKNSEGWLKRMGRFTLRGLGIRPERSGDDRAESKDTTDRVPEYRILSDEEPVTSETIPEDPAEILTDDLTASSPGADSLVDGSDGIAEETEEPVIILDAAELATTEVSEGSVDSTVAYEHRRPEFLESEHIESHHHPEPLAATGMVLGAAEHHRVSKLKKRTRRLEEEHEKDRRTTKDIKERYEELQREMKQVAQKMDRSGERGAEVRRAKEPAIKPRTPEAASRPEIKRQPEAGITTVFERATRQSPLEKPHEVLEERPMTQEEVLPPIEISEPKIEPVKYELHKENDPYKIAAAEATPDVVLEEVEKAAEKNVPLEAFYERRQEVKDLDDISAPGGTVSGTGGGGWVSPSAVPVTTPMVMPLPASPANRSGDNKLADLWNKQPKIYQQAMTTSAGAALLVVLVAAALMALLS